MNIDDDRYLLLQRHGFVIVDIERNLETDNRNCPLIIDGLIADNQYKSLEPPFEFAVRPLFRETIVFKILPVIIAIIFIYLFVVWRLKPIYQQTLRCKVQSQFLSGMRKETLPGILSRRG